MEPLSFGLAELKKSGKKESTPLPAKTKEEGVRATLDTASLIGSSQKRGRFWCHNQGRFCSPRNRAAAQYTHAAARSRKHDLHVTLLCAVARYPLRSHGQGGQYREAYSLHSSAYQSDLQHATWSVLYPWRRCHTLYPSLEIGVWDDDGRIEEIEADDSPCYVDQINVNFMEYHASVKPLEINMSTFDPLLIKGCYVGAYGMKLVPKADAANPYDSQQSDK
ncbi:hypothetical protein PIB30_073935 [Stylosanthes scabra]|uniref:Uncharacterized protein n=1 Tax=Stylosanthes scabra TaxID=79078 RepID=A0ABU6SQ26_9FABA|nr:hypothetical protein [Stylosanthes scabra]